MPAFPPKAYSFAKARTAEHTASIEWHGRQASQFAVVILGAASGGYACALSAAPALLGGLAPAMYESVGKRTPAGRRAGNTGRTATLVEATGGAGRMHDNKNYLTARHACLTPRRGGVAPRSPGPTRCSPRPTTCCSATSPTKTSPPTG